MGNISGGYHDVVMILAAQRAHPTPGVQAHGTGGGPFGGAPSHAELQATQQIPQATYDGLHGAGTAAAVGMIAGAVPVLGHTTGAAFGIGAWPSSFQAAVNARNPAAVPHIADAMISLLGMMFGSAMADTRLTDNHQLWQFEDNFVPTGVDIQYNWIRNGQPTGVRNTRIDTYLPNSLQAGIGIF